MSVCATKKSKLHPKVFTVVELRKKAKSKGHEAKLVKSLNKSQLCNLLNIKWEGQKPGATKKTSITVPTKKSTTKPIKSITVPTKKAKIVIVNPVKKTTKKPTTKKPAKNYDVLTIDTITLDGRDCDKNPSVKNPTAFSKDELVTLAIKKLAMKKTEATKMKKSEICALLNATSKTISKPTKTTKSTKTVTTTKKKISNKKPAPKPTKTKKQSEDEDEEEEEQSEEQSEEQPTTKKTTKAKATKKPTKTTKAKATKKTKSTKKKTSSPIKGTKSKTTKTKSPKKPKTKKPKTSNKKSKQDEIDDSDPIIQKAGNCIERSNLKLKKHQKILVDFLRNNRGIIAAFDVGTGKTLTAVTASQCFLDSTPKGKVIVVTPVSLQDNFKKEIRAYGADPNDNRYEFYTIAKFATTFNTKEFPKNTFLIIDEAHNLRTLGKSKSKVSRAQTAIKCAKIAVKVLLLTATPTFNGPQDMINLAAMVKGEDALSTYKFDTMTPMEQCNYFRDTIMFFENPKTDDYPTVREHNERIVMSPEFYRKYRNVEVGKDELWTDKSPFMFLTGVRISTDNIDPSQKCEWTINKIKEGQKTVVFSAFVTAGVKKLQGMLVSTGIKYVEITGKTSKEDRTLAVNKYNNDKAQVFFITKAGGEGLDLKGTRNVILLEKSWNRPTEEQIIGRAARYKSHTHLPKDQHFVDVYHLIITKPKFNRDLTDNRESADDILNVLTINKEKNNRIFSKLLHSIAIDSPNGTKCPPFGYEPPKPIKTTKNGTGGKYSVTIRDSAEYDLELTDDQKAKITTRILAYFPKTTVNYEDNSIKFNASSRGKIVGVCADIDEILVKFDNPKTKWSYSKSIKRATRSWKDKLSFEYEMNYIGNPFK